MAELSGSRTQQNLIAAFARETQSNHRYLWFAQLADVEGHPDVAALFRSVADGEIGHAQGLLEFLADVGDPISGLPIGDTRLNLRAAIAGESHDAVATYPKFASTARDEGFDDVAAWFDSLAGAEARQADRFRDSLDALG